jgi:hypothetical protein
MALSTSSKPKIEGLGTSDRKLAIMKPEHIKRGILILLGIATLLVIAAVWKGISNSRSFEARQEARRAERSKREDAAADKAAEANTNSAASFQQDVATFQRNGVAADPAATATTAPAGTTAAPTGPDATSVKLQEAMNEERIRAYKDIREPLALAVPNGDKPVGTTTTASVRQVSQPEPDAQAQAQAQAPADAETQALLQQRARLAEQLRLLEQSAAGAR